MATPNVIRHLWATRHAASPSAASGSSAARWTLTPPTTSARRSRARRRATSTRARATAGLQAAGLCAIYAFARRVHDTAEGRSAPRGEAAVARERAPASLGTARHGRSTRRRWRSAMST